MTERIELTIIAESEDDFDDLCDQAEALYGVTLKAKIENKEIAAKLVTGYRYNDENLEVTLELDAKFARILDISINGRETLLVIENFTRH